MLPKPNSFIRANVILMIDCYAHGLVETCMGDIISLGNEKQNWEAISENHDDDNSNWNLLNTYCAFSFWRHWVFDSYNKLLRQLLLSLYAHLYIEK